MFGFGREKPKEEGQGEARHNQQKWIETVTGENQKEKTICNEGMVEPKGISEESIKGGYEGGHQYNSGGMELTADSIPETLKDGGFLTPFQQKQLDKINKGEGDDGSEERLAA